ncbi:MAG: S-adenosyl-l-methionine hydroxide adenosyltransferase family protein [Vampirovibrionales bacterium]
MNKQALTLAFLSDYGNSDAYAGILHAVALSRLTPEAKQLTQRLDLTHGIAPFDIRAGAWSLLQALPYLPPHTVTVAVVDPQVGSPEQGIALVFRPSFQQVFIAPDNGLLAPLLACIPDAYALRLTRPNIQAYAWFYASVEEQASAGNTFHGRDIYTPLACAVLNAWARRETFPLLEQTEPAPLRGISPFPPSAQRHDDGFTAHVLLQDGYGNLITTLPSHWIDPTVTHLQVTHHDAMWTLPMVSSYAEGNRHPQGVALRGSHGYIELARSQADFSSDFNRDDELSISMLY